MDTNLVDKLNEHMENLTPIARKLMLKKAGLYPKRNNPGMSAEEYFTRMSGEIYKPRMLAAEIAGNILKKIKGVKEPQKIYKILISEITKKLEEY